MTATISPFVIGWVAESKGLGGAFFLCAGSFFLATLVATQLPETKGKQLD